MIETEEFRLRRQFLKCLINLEKLLDYKGYDNYQRINELAEREFNQLLRLENQIYCEIQ